MRVCSEWYDKLYKYQAVLKFDDLYLCHLKDLSITFDREKCRYKYEADVVASSLTSLTKLDGFHKFGNIAMNFTDNHMSGRQSSIHRDEQLHGTQLKVEFPNIILNLEDIADIKYTNSDSSKFKMILLDSIIKCPGRVKYTELRKLMPDVHVNIHLLKRIFKTTDKGKKMVIHDIALSLSMK